MATIPIMAGEAWDNYLVAADTAYDTFAAAQIAYDNALDLAQGNYRIAYDAARVPVSETMESDAWDNYTAVKKAYVAAHRNTWKAACAAHEAMQVAIAADAYAAYVVYDAMQVTYAANVVIEATAYAAYNTAQIAYDVALVANRLNGRRLYYKTWERINNE